MSTAIGPAYKLDPNIDVFVFAEKLRAVVKPAVKLAFYTYVQEEAVNAYDDAPERRPFFEVVKEEISNRCHCPTEDRSWVVRGLTTLTGHMYSDPATGDKYLLTMGAPTEVKEAIHQMEEVVGDFSYYNATDEQLETLTGEEWDNRRDTWDRMLDKSGLVSATGISLFLGCKAWEFSAKEYLEYAPTLPEIDVARRENRMLKRLYANEIVNGGPASERHEFLMENLMSLFNPADQELFQEEQFPTEAATARQKHAALWEERKTLN